MRLYLCSILLIIIIILTFYLNKNTESFENDIDLNGKWIINSDIPNKTKLINIFGKFINNFDHLETNKYLNQRM